MFSPAYVIVSQQQQM